MTVHRLFLTTVWLLASCDVARPPLRVYRIGESETLGHIAQKTSVSVAQLKSLNHLESDVIEGGSGLLVPATRRTMQFPEWVPPAPAPEWKPCRAVEWVTPKQTTDRCQCAGEACFCLPEASEDDDRAQLTFGNTRWTSEVFPFEDPHAFRHARVDLDGDGRPESVVSVREGVGNGLAVEWWKHVLLHEGRPVASFVTIDYGESYVEQPQGCALLATSHEWRTDPLRGDGSYWLARLHVLRDGAMRATGPEVARRYTYRFARQRWGGLETELAQPLPWFTDVGAFVWPEPNEPPPVCRRATLLSEGPDGRFDLGDAGVFQPRESYRDEPLPADVHEYDALVDSVTGAPLMESYRSLSETSGRCATVCEGSRTTLAIDDQVYTSAPWRPTQSNRE